MNVFDLDGVSLDELPRPRDFVLAFSIPYLENPLRALRIARALCRGAMLLETMTLPNQLPTARVIRENPNPTQGLRELALLLGPAAIEWGLWAAGFRNIYRFVGSLDHPDFADTADLHRRRHVWLALDRPAEIAEFEAIQIVEPRRENFWLRK